MTPTTAPEGATQILMFHRVRPNLPVAFGLPDTYRLRGTSLTPDELSDVLDDASTVLPLRRVQAALEAGATPPPGVVLTFDDGYREHLDLVAPLLTARGLAATFYVATGLHADGGAVALVDAWYWLLDHAKRPNARIPLPSGGVFAGPVDTLEGKTTWVCGPPKRALLEAPRAHQHRMLEALAASTGATLPTDLADRLYLRPDEWPLLAHGHGQLGAHTVRHHRLTTLDGDALRTEVVDSMERLRPVSESKAFAYPDGDFDDRVVDVVRRAGATSAVTCIPGCVTASSDLLRLPRIFVRPPGD